MSNEKTTESYGCASQEVRKPKAGTNLLKAVVTRISSHALHWALLYFAVVAGDVGAGRVLGFLTFLGLLSSITLLLNEELGQGEPGRAWLYMLFFWGGCALSLCMIYNGWWIVGTAKFFASTLAMGTLVTSAREKDAAKSGGAT